MTFRLLLPDILKSKRIQNNPKHPSIKGKEDSSTCTSVKIVPLQGGKMGEQIKAIATKSDHLSSIPVTHMVAGENRQQAFLGHPHVHSGSPAHIRM